MSTQSPESKVTLDPRVELLAETIHRHIEEYRCGPVLGHDGMYQLAISALKALNRANALAVVFETAWIDNMPLLCDEVEKLITRTSDAIHGDEYIRRAYAASAQRVARAYRNATTPF